VVFAGLDYEDVLAAAEAESDLIIWDGGNNELPFIEPDVHVVLVDPLRPGAETTYHPGEANLRSADHVICNKENSATSEDIEDVVSSIQDVNPSAEVLHSDSEVTVEHPDNIEGSTVLVVEDGPTVTHGDASYGAGTVAARKFDAADRVEPREFAVGSIASVLDSYPHLDRV
ncbi:MAG: GTPase, partial [Halobacteriaceae archaeon]